MTAMQVDACASHIERYRSLIGGSGIIRIDAGGAGVSGIGAKLKGDTLVDPMVAHRAGRTAQRPCYHLSGWQR